MVSVFVYIILGLSVILNIFLIIGVRNLILQSEDFDRRMLVYRTYVLEKIGSALKALKDADIKGSFESDDEVGSVFEDMKSIINELTKTPF